MRPLVSTAHTRVFIVILVGPKKLGHLAAQSSINHPQKLLDRQEKTQRSGLQKWPCQPKDKRIENPTATFGAVDEEGINCNPMLAADATILKNFFTRCLSQSAAKAHKSFFSQFFRFFRKSY